jgi:hypothetical protein
MGSIPRKSRIPAPERPSEDSPAPAARRRGFLLALGAGGLGAAAVATRALTGASPATSEGATDTSAGEGYRVTDHVKRYYRTAKL